MKASIREPLIRFMVKHPWFTAGALAVALGIVAVLVLVSGIVPIKASDGHWQATERLLDFAKVQSVRTHSIGVAPPDLDDEALVVRGAVHYAMGCYACHGGPDAKVPPVMSGMTPSPPQLTADTIGRWKAAQLFSIVKHGIKFTGMPAWPFPQRDDEIWAVVAFLRKMSTLDVGEYRRLAHGYPEALHEAGPDFDILSVEIEPPEPVRDLCWRCHGVDGTGRAEGAIPSLAGQRAAYLHGSLRAFADRIRFSATMAEVASRLDDEAMRQIAAYYERLPVRATTSTADTAARSRGATIATMGIPERDIPACVECHGPTAVPKNPAYPRLAGQHARYLRLQLALLKERRRGGSPNVNLMHEVIDRLSMADMLDVTHYYSLLSPQLSTQ